MYLYDIRHCILQSQPKDHPLMRVKVLRTVDTVRVYLTLVLLTDAELGGLC